MSNLTSSSQITMLYANQSLSPSLDALLDQLGFEMWHTIINTYILPPINLIGIAFCSFSLWIFSKYSFEDPIFFYFKLLSFVNIINLLHNIPACILFSPRLLPSVNTYFTSTYIIYYASVSSFLFHFEEVLQMGILLHKMKLFVPFVRKYYTARPQIISLAFFLTCLLIDLPFAFSLKIVSLGDYIYINSNGVQQKASFFYYTSSDFSQTFYGQILLSFTFFFFFA